MNKKLNNALIRHPIFDEALARIESLERRTLESEQLVLPLCGPSRAGKNFSTEALRRRHTPRTEGTRRVMPCIYVKTPAKPSLSSLPKAILQAAGMGRWATRGGPDTLTMAAEDAVRRIGAKFMIVDEFQHFAQAGAHASQIDVSDWLKNFIDKTGVSAILLGMPTMMSVLARDEQLHARCLAPHHLLPYCWSVAVERSEYTLALEAMLDLLEQQGYRFRPPEDLALRMYTASGGRIGTTVKLLNEACEESRGGLIDEDALARAYSHAINHPTAGQNPFLADPKEADAHASYTSLMKRSGYDAAFIDSAIAAKATSRTEAKALRSMSRNAAVEEARGRLGC